MLGGATTLQGRDAQLALLEGALGDAVTGRGRLALVTGEAGIGKSALAAAIAHAAESKGAIVTWGRAWEYADAPPYFPVWPCLRALGIEHDRTKSSEADVFQLWEHVLSRIGALPRDTPHVWVLEDLHASDLQTLDLLTFLAQPIRSAGLLVIATARAKDPRLTDRMQQRLGRMAREGLDVRLAPLADLEVAALAESTLGRAVPAAMVKRLVDVTHGNPLFVIECARAIDGGGNTALPATVRQVVLERVALLDESTRNALACGAVLGRDFAAATAARMRGVQTARIIDSLLPALRAGILGESRPGHFVFSHTLVCEAIEDALDPSERAALHARAADALAPLGEGTDVVVDRARHALLSLGIDGSDCEASIALATRAATLLEAQGAFDRAFGLHERLDDARRSGHAPPSTPDERLRVAQIAEAAGRYADSQRICDEVIAAARAAGDAELFARAVLLVGKALRPGVVLRSLVALLEEARFLLRARSTAPSSPELDARLLARLAAALQPAPDPEMPCAMAREAIAKARAIGDDATLLEVLEMAGSALVDFARPPERIAAASELLQRATKAGDRPKMMRGRTRLAFELLAMGDFEAFGEQVDEMIALADELGHPRYRWRVLLTASLRAVASGHFAESDRYLVELGQIATLTDDPALPLSLGSHELTRARIQRRDKEARHHADQISRLIESVPYGEAYSAVLRAAAFARMDDTDATRAEIAKLGTLRSMLEDDPSARDWCAEAYAVAGSVEDRLRVRALLRALPDDSESHGGHVTYTYDGPTAFFLARLEASFGEHALAIPLLERAIARSTKHGHRPFIAQMSYELGTALDAVGRPADARRAFEVALAIADELPMPGLAIVLRARMTMHGRATSPAPPLAAPPPQAGLPFRLAREGDVWRIEHGPRAIRVKDSRGVQLLARLVERPDEEIHVLVLASDEGASIAETTAGDQLDDRARREYKTRLADLASDIEEAERNADRGRVEKLRAEAEALETELARAVGLGGKSRQAGSSTERARVNVQRRLKDALARIAEADAALGRALERAVKTGTFCCFRP